MYIDERSDMTAAPEKWTVTGHSETVRDESGAVVSHVEVRGEYARVDVPRLIAAARKLVMGSEGYGMEKCADYVQVLRLDDETEGAAGALHDELRKALGITEEEWQAGR